MAIIDRLNGKDGLYRVLIRPDHLGNENEKWPEALRLGSAVGGWIMLKDVPIWWEVWRQLNGFPPEYIEDEKTQERK